MCQLPLSAVCVQHLEVSDVADIGSVMMIPWLLTMLHLTTAKLSSSDEVPMEKK